MRLSEYDKIPALSAADTFVLDTATGTKSILAADIAKSLLGLAPTEDVLSGIDISDLDTAQKLKSDDVLWIGTENGNERIKVSDVIFKVFDASIDYPSRRNLWRGKNLGSVVTDEQWDAIENNSFKDLFIGDYWNIGSYKWRIVDFNYWIGSGDVICTTPHLVIMPDGGLFQAKMNPTNTTVGGYVGSAMYTSRLPDAKTIIDANFGSDHILNHREPLSNSVQGGVVTGVSWYDSTVEIPNEIMMYGCYLSASTNTGNNSFYSYTVGKTQLAAMRINPYLINPVRQNQWLRDIASNNSFTNISYNGAGVDNVSSSDSIFVRPVFGIKK